MSEIIKTLRSELEATTVAVRQIEAEVVRAQDRLRFSSEKVDRLKALLAIYEAEAAATMPGVDRPLSATDSPEVPTVSIPRPDITDARPKPVFKKVQMERAIAALLSERGTAHRNSILSHLVSLGIMGSEKDPLAHLAAFLSDNRGRFESDGRGNFVLKPAEYPTIASQDTGSKPSAADVVEITSARPNVGGERSSVTEKIQEPTSRGSDEIGPSTVPSSHGPLRGGVVPPSLVREATR